MNTAISSSTDGYGAQARQWFCDFVGNDDTPGKALQLRNCAIERLDHFDAWTEETIPSNAVQRSIDSLALRCDEKVKELSTRLFLSICSYLPKSATEGERSWAAKKAISIATIPFSTIYSLALVPIFIVGSVFYIALHPLKASIKIARIAVNVIYETTKPETWSTAGARTIGIGVAGMIETGGNPLFIPLLGAGLISVIGGLAAGILAAAIKAKEGERLEKMKKQFIKQIEPLPEAFLAGFCLGLVLAGLQQALPENSFIHSHIGKMSYFVNQNSEQK